MGDAAEWKPRLPDAGSSGPSPDVIARYKLAVEQLAEAPFRPCILLTGMGTREQKTAVTSYHKGERRMRWSHHPRDWGRLRLSASPAAFHVALPPDAQGRTSSST